MKIIENTENKTSCSAVAHNTDGFSFSQYPIVDTVQTKLTIGQSGDIYEKKADRMADPAMSMPDSPTIQSKYNEGEKEETLQTKPFSNTITPLAQTQINKEEEDLQTKPLVMQTTPWIQKQGIEREVPFPEGASSEKTPWIQRATNPDGVELGPTDRSRSFCEQQTLWATTTTQNTPTRARGIQTVWFKGNNTGSNDDNVNCSCGCGLYRHWIRGYWRDRLGGPKRFDNVSSCGTYITINENTWTEEYTTCFGDNDADACDWEYADHPGWESGLSDGSYVELHFEFKYQIWDTCNNRSVAQAKRTLDISGDTHPRTITWSTP